MIKVFGYTPEEIAANPNLWFGRIHKDDAARVKKAFDELIQQGSLFDIEYRLQRKDGTWIWIHDRAATTYRKGDRRYADGIFRDITRHKMLEDALQKSEANYRSLFENSTIGIVITGPDLLFQKVNTAFCKMVEFCEEELVGKKSIGDITHPDDRSQSKELLEKLIRNEIDHFVIEKRYVAKSGKIIHALNFSRGMYDNAGHYLNGTASILDITERKKLEEELCRHRDNLEDLVQERTIELETKNAKLSKEIAQRKQAEDALRLERDKAQQYLDIAGVMFLAIDKKGNIILINKKGQEMLGFEEKDLLGKNWIENFIPEHHRQEVQQEFEKILRGDIAYLEYHENEIVTRTRGERLVAWHNTLLKDAKDNIIGTLSSGEDITERRRAEEALRESEELFRTLAENSPNMIFINQGGKLIYVNKRLVEITEYSLDEIYDPQFDFLNFIAPEYRDAIWKNFERHALGSEVLEMEYAIISKSGRRIEAIYGTRIISFHGKPAILGVITDITVRKRAEEALRESEARLNDAQALGKIGNWEFDISAEKIIWSAQTYRLFERDPALGPPSPEEEAKYYPLDQLAKTREYARLAIEQGTSFKYDIAAILPSGKKVHFSTTMQPIKDAHGHVSKLFGTVQDITEQKHVEKERQALLEQVEQISDLKSNLITQAAHELKTPLTAILGWGELLYNAKRQGKSLDTTFDVEDIETILRNAERLNDLVNDFLDVGRIESGKLGLNKQNVDFAEIVENSTQAVGYLARQKQIEIVTQFSQQSIISVDRRRMEQVLINLLSNSIKYSPENTRVTVKTGTVEVSGRRMFQIQVLDNGYGFTPEELAEAMTPFGKASTQQEQKRSIQGTGLGLFISSRIVDQHHGTLSIRSEGVNKGTQVYIVLPLEEGSQKNP